MPWAVRMRRIQSAIRYERRLPMCASLYTVGPQVYILMTPVSTGLDLVEASTEGVVDLEHALRLR